MKELEELTQEIREKLPRLIYIEILDFTYYKCKAKRFREPMLNDVLEWFKLNKETTGSNLLTMFIEGEFSKNRNLVIDSWDLSKPYLKDQSPELIEFLHGFIKK